MDYLQTDALSVGYNGKTLISKVALSVQRGRIVTLIGPNGSGKSTILKTIIGQLPSISGSVFLDGADMRSRSRGDVARRMAILMTARMDPELMTCRDVVSTGRYPYTGHLGVLRPEDKAIVEQSLRETDALDFADRPFQSISDGQRQRVLLARALCQQPELIVLDEPTSFLDIRYKLELLTLQAVRVLENTPVIAAPQTASGQMLALDIARGAVDLTGKSVLPLRFTMSHDAAVRAESYRAAASAVEAELRQGRDVAMVNLGDVALFATAYYIFAEIERDGFPARMLPGVTSVAAVAARLGQSLTEMEQPLHILPASCDLDAALALPGTKVLMKSGSAIHEIVAALGRAGLLKRASMVADCGLPSERVFRDLREIPENVSYFATILVRSE